MILPPFQKVEITLPTGVVMPVLQLGHGEVPVATILGGGDGLSTVHQSARQLARFYRRRLPHHSMHIISRREDIPADYSLDHHAADVIGVLDELQLGPVVLECNSAGGPIGQLIAAHRPDLVRALVLASTAHRMNRAATDVVRHWLELVQNERWGQLGWDATRRMYRRAQRWAWVAPLFAPVFHRVTRPKHPDRIERILRGLLGFDNSEILAEISSPTLVFGGTEDPIFSAELQREMARGIPDSRLVLAAGYLHAADLESPQYPAAVTQLIADTEP